MKGTKFQKTDLALSIVVLFGMMLVGSKEGANIAAIFVGLLSAFFAAFFSVSNAILVEKVPATQLTVMELTSGFILISLFMLFQGKMNAELFQINTKLLWQLLFLGVICTAIAFVLAVNATKHLGAFTVSLTINLEPIYTILLALLYFPESEKMGLTFYIGATIILTAVIGNSIIKQRIKRKQISTLSKP
jgi:drug/metabolite transporter (DMT)-like permease